MRKHLPVSTFRNKKVSDTKTPSCMITLEGRKRRTELEEPIVCVPASDKMKEFVKGMMVTD